MHKRGLIETLLHRSFRLCSSYESFHREIETLKLIFKHNNYPQNNVNQCIKKFLNKLFIKKDLNFMVPKRELIFVLPYLGKLSLDLRTRCRRTIERDLPYCKLKKIFRSKCRLNTLFRLKDPLEKKIRSGIIYRYTCKVIFILQGYLLLENLPSLLYKSGDLQSYRKMPQKPAISDHLLQCNCTINFEDFSILATDCNKFKLLLKVQITF